MWAIWDLEMCSDQLLFLQSCDRVCCGTMELCRMALSSPHSPQPPPPVKYMTKHCTQFNFCHWKNFLKPTSFTQLKNFCYEDVIKRLLVCAWIYILYAVQYSVFVCMYLFIYIYIYIWALKWMYGVQACIYLPMNIFESNLWFLSAVYNF
jgi:hypothetical protein